MLEREANLKAYTEETPLNTIMLGIISNFLALPMDHWKTVIKKAMPPKFKELNLVAFEKGRALG